MHPPGMCTKLPYSSVDCSSVNTVNTGVMVSPPAGLLMVFLDLFRFEPVRGRQTDVQVDGHDP